MQTGLLEMLMLWIEGAGIVVFDARNQFFFFGRPPTLEFFPHSCDLFEIFCPSLGGLIPANLPRAFYN